MAGAADTREPAELLRDFLERIAETLALSAEIDVTDDGETLTGTLHGGDLGLFIGRHGQTIDAVQHLAVRIVQNTEEGRERRVVVDAEGYRKRRAEVLCRQADEAAEQAVKYSRPVALDAMTSGERRLVHEYLRERGDVETYSEGEEPDRHLIVAPLS